MFEQNNDREENIYLDTICLLIAFIFVANKGHKYFWSLAFWWAQTESALDRTVNMIVYWRFII